MYSLKEILLVLCSIASAIAFISFIRTALKTRKKFSEIYKFMIGFIIFTLLVWDETFRFYLFDAGIITVNIFITYRFISDLILGFVTLYLFIDIILKELKRKYICKFFVFTIGVMLLEGYLIIFIQNPSIFISTNFFEQLFYFYDINLLIFIIYGVGKLYILVGFILFCGYFIYIVLKNHFYSIKTKILATIGVLAFMDITFKHSNIYIII